MERQGHKHLTGHVEDFDKQEDDYASWKLEVRGWKIEVGK